LRDKLVQLCCVSDMELNRLENREWDFATVERDVSKVRDISDDSDIT